MCYIILTKYIFTIIQHILGRCFTKPAFGAFGKWKMLFSRNKVENFIRQYCLPCQDAHVCTIWAHYHKLCHHGGHNIGCLAWKPYNFILDSSFWEHFLKIFEILQVCYFIWILGHIISHNAKVFHFFEFFWITYACFKTRWKRRAWPMLQGVESEETLSVSLMKQHLLNLKMIFLKNLEQTMKHL